MANQNTMWKCWKKSKNQEKWQNWRTYTRLFRLPWSTLRMQKSVPKQIGMVFQPQKSSLLLYDLVNKHVKETWNTLESSRWRENLHHYIEEMEDLTRRKPGYKATMNTYAPCRPIMENLQCVRNVLNNSEQHKSVFFPQGQLVYQPVTHFGYGFRQADSECSRGRALSLCHKSYVTILLRACQLSIILNHHRVCLLGTANWRWGIVQRRKTTYLSVLSLKFRHTHT